MLEAKTTSVDRPILLTVQQVTLYRFLKLWEFPEEEAVRIAKKNGNEFFGKAR